MKLMSHPEFGYHQMPDMYYDEAVSAGWREVDKAIAEVEKPDTMAAHVGKPRGRPRKAEVIDEV